MSTINIFLFEECWINFCLLTKPEIIKYEPSKEIIEQKIWVNKYSSKILYLKKKINVKRKIIIKKSLKNLKKISLILIFSLITVGPKVLLKIDPGKDPIA